MKIINLPNGERSTPLASTVLSSVDVGKYKISSSSDEIVETGELNSCVSIIGYKDGICFVTHCDSIENVTKIWGELTKDLRAFQGEGKYEIAIVCGASESSSELIEEIKKKISQEKDLFSEDIYVSPSEELGPKSVAFDQKAHTLYINNDYHGIRFRKIREGKGMEFFDRSQPLKNNLFTSTLNNSSTQTHIPTIKHH